MAKYLFRLKSIEYSGDSVGEEVKLEIKAQGKLFTMDTKLRHSTTLTPNQEIFSFESDSISVKTALPKSGRPSSVKLTNPELFFPDLNSGYKPYDKKKRALVEIEP